MIQIRKWSFREVKSPPPQVTQLGSGGVGAHKLKESDSRGHFWKHSPVCCLGPELCLHPKGHWPCDLEQTASSPLAWFTEKKGKGSQDGHAEWLGGTEQRAPRLLTGPVSAKNVGCALWHGVFVCLHSYCAICSDLIVT